MTSQPPHGDSPQAERPRSTTAILVASGVVLGAILLVILYTIRTGVPEEQAASTPTDDIPELIPPRITAGEFDGTTDPLSADTQVELERGGWIQVPDPDDPQRLAQRYRCERLDPNPEGAGPGWVEMTAPRAELHLSRRRIVTLVGESARVFLNNRAMESGRITGNVVIRMYESADEQQPPDLSGDPSLVIYTDDAELDNFLGEVNCRGDMFASTPTMDFHGRDLTLRISDRENRIESMTVETPHWIRLTSDAAELPGQDNMAGKRRAVRLARARATRYAPNVSDVAPYVLPASAAQPSADLDGIQFYKLTLSEDVNILQGDDVTGRAAFGDRLHVWFAMEGSEAAGLLGRDNASPSHADNAGPTRRASDQRINRSSGERLLQVRSDTEGRPYDPRSIAGPPAADDVHVTCSGPLEMTPTAETPPDMVSGEDTHLQLEGAPVRLYDYADGIEASCGVLRFESAADRFSLGSGHGRIVRINSPQFDLLADYLEVRQTDARAELDGPGEMVLRRDAAEQEQSDVEQLRITWERGVELAFLDEPDGEADSRAMRRLERAIFDGEVAVVSDDFDLRSEHLDVGFRADGEETDDIESIFARGNVEARTARDQSTLACDELQLDMIPDADGRSSPSRLEASGVVRAAGEQGTLWTPHLLVHFFDPDDPARPARDETGTASGEETLFSDAAVRTVEAGDDVQIRLADGQRVFADRLFADAEQETLDLTGENVMLLADTAWIDRTQRLTYHDGDGTARLDGSGRLQFLEAGLPQTDDGPIDPPDVSGDSVVTWRDGVDLTFSTPSSTSDVDGDGSRSLRTALFTGDVDVRTPDLRMTSDDMEVHFTDDAESSDDIETVLARGNVRAVAEQDDGTLTCDQLRLDLEPDLLGRAAPSKMTATGDVEASGEEGVMWSQRLVARFISPDDPDRLDAARNRDESTDNAGPLGSAEIQTVTAEHDVQLRLSNGERVYADHLFADAEKERIELTGENVQMFVDNAWVDRGRTVVYHETDRTARFDGPGRLRMMDDPVQPAARGPAEPPDIDGEPQLLAQWRESMFFDELANDGGGFIRLVGDVLVTTDLHDEQAKQFEQRRITGHTLELDLVRVDGGEGRVESGRLTGDRTDDQLGGRREVRRLVAQGVDDELARIDALAWPDAQRQEEPRILSVRGRHIDHDAETQYSHIDGAGVLVVHDLSEEREEEGDRFAGRGTTRFQWRDSLEMTREMADLYRVIMVGDVQVEHQSIDGEVATLTSRRLRASIVQDEAGDDSAGADPVRDNELIEASGSSRLRRLVATEDVFIRTPEYDVDCDEFDYDVSTALAVLSSETSRGVSVYRRSTGQSFNHHRARWFMDETNRIIIERGGAGMGN